jgi:sugar phosphate isomerase/epimerase
MEVKWGFSIIQKPVEQYFEYAAKYGLSHLEIDLLQEHSFIESFTAERIANLRYLSQKFSVSLSLHTPYMLNLSDRISIVRNATIVYLKKTIMLANKLRATHITTHIGYCNRLPDPKKSKTRALQRLAVNLKELISTCRRCKVKLALENVNPVGDNCEFIYLGDSIEDFDFLFLRLKSPYINLCLDVGHANTGQGVLAYIKEFSSKIICVHYHDNKGRYDEHLEVGEGTVPWRKVAAAFKKINFAGPFVSESFRRLKPHQVRNRFLEYF